MKNRTSVTGQAGIVHHLLVFIVAAVVLTVSGIAVYRIYGNNIGANAAVADDRNPYFAKCPPLPKNRPVLSLGSKDSDDPNTGNCVKALQRAMNDSMGVGLKENGNFNKAMDREIKDIKSFFGDENPSGSVDEEMWDLMDYFQAVAIINAGGKYKSPHFVWSKARGVAVGNEAKADPVTKPAKLKSAKTVRSEIVKGAEPELLIHETFKNTLMQSRGWSGNITGCKSVMDKSLEKNVVECQFKNGAEAPVGNTNSVSLPLRGGAEEFTVKFKVKPVGDVSLGSQTIHAFYTMSNKDGGGQPANSHNTLYFDPIKREGGNGSSTDWTLVFQDNKAIDCSYVKTEIVNGKPRAVKQDLFGIVENRSVGGTQQQYQADGRVRPGSWGNPCEGGLNSYTGQSTWYLDTNGSKPVEKGKWTDVIYYVKYNTPGKFDGRVYVAAKAEGESKWVTTFESNKIMFRSNGSNKDARADKFVFGPWASSNSYNFSMRWTDLMVFSGDAR